MHVCSVTLPKLWLGPLKIRKLGIFASTLLLTGWSVLFIGVSDLNLESVQKMDQFFSV